MTMKERLEMHCQIERGNERKLNEWKAKKLISEFHLLLVREGRYDDAYLLLRLLRNGTVRLGLYDSASRVEHLLENLGFKARYGRNYNTAEYSLARWEGRKMA